MMLCMKAVYPGDGDPDATPGVSRQTRSEPDDTSVSVEVDGESFLLRDDGQGGTDYTWLSGPNSGYGFAEGPHQNMSMNEHRQNIRWFLAEIDFTTGYLRED